MNKYLNHKTNLDSTDSGFFIKNGVKRCLFPEIAFINEAIGNIENLRTGQGLGKQPSDQTI